MRLTAHFGAGGSSWGAGLGAVWVQCAGAAEFARDHKYGEKKDLHSTPSRGSAESSEIRSSKKVVSIALLEHVLSLGVHRPSDVPWVHRCTL
jgi:hypothetical protein